MIGFTEEELDYLQQLVLKYSGVLVTEKASTLALTRLTDLLVEFSLSDPGTLIELLREAGPESPLSHRVVELLLETDTFFFRDSSAFEFMRHDALPKLIARNMEARSLRIWCAGCSTGQEVYSLAVMLYEAMPEFRDWKIEILGTDMNPRLIERAKTGVYSQKEVDQGLPRELSFRHFRQIGPQWVIREEFRKCTSFQELNLLSEWKGLPRFDIILMRNVLRYFQTTARTKVLSQLHRHMHHESFLFVGNNEEITHPSFGRIRASNAPCYCRIETEGSEEDLVGPSAPEFSDRSFEFKMGTRLSITGPEFRQLSQLANRTYLFKGMSIAEMEAVCRKIGLFEFTNGQVIIEQGHKGDAFYIVYSGKARVIRRKGFFRRSEEIAILGPGDIFGEMSLILSEACNATVVAEGQLKAFVCEREVFEDLSAQSETFSATLRTLVGERRGSPAPSAALSEDNSNQKRSGLQSGQKLSMTSADASVLLELLAKSYLFGSLSSEELERIASQTELFSFTPGDMLLKEGVGTEYFFVLYNGRAHVRVGESGLEVATLNSGDIFGEVALISNAPCNSTVVAADAVTTFGFSRAVYEDLRTTNPTFAAAIEAILSEQPAKR